MAHITSIKVYFAAEERMNVLSHGIGFILSTVALVLLVIRASLFGTVWHIVSFTIFGFSLMVLYAASTLYHKAVKKETRQRLKIFDHASIYVLIAGTYTPFTLVTLHGSIGWLIFSVTWALALSGIVLKLFFTGKYTRLSTIMYVLMGWIIIFAIKPLIAHLLPEGLFWLVAGGLAYTIGAIIYSIKRITFNHAIFHQFVLLGSFCHFISVYYYMLPA